MSQRAVEGLLGRLVTDEAFRKWFQREPAAACTEGSFDVTMRELEAILKLEVGYLEELAKRLDARIVRAPEHGSRSVWVRSTTLDERSAATATGSEPIGDGGERRHRHTNGRPSGGLRK